MNKEAKIKLKNIHINTISRQVRRSRKKVNLTKKEFDLLEFLARNKNRVLNRLTILEYVWNYKV
ncbi:winged helix-turn-helix domain-containing protein, partial [Patescibacteria group bacterium]|nr:winged helix-turn-helix domain-containing protein [Patescibacteria group bacterium]